MPRINKNLLVNVKKSGYAMTMNKDSSAEIIFYGDIVSEQPVDWWTGEPLPGQYVTLEGFLEDLKLVESATTIKMRINSLGGDSNTALTIHNRLRDLKAHKIAIIDGAAMSGGTHLACAADEVWVYSSSQYMIHLCWSFICGAFSRTELEERIKTHDAVDKSQVAIYQRKTDKSEEELMEMMKETTYLVGQEIIDAGFADKLIDNEDEEPLFQASEASGTYFVNGNPIHLPQYAFAKMASHRVNQPSDDTSAKTTDGQTEIPEPQESEDKIVAKTLEELKTEDPSLYQAFIEEAKQTFASEKKTAVDEERQRISDIDSISAKYSEEAIREAKYGESACTAQEFTFREAQKAAKAGSSELEKMNADFQASNTGDVSSSAGQDTGSDKPMTKEERIAAGSADAKKVSGN